MINRWRMDGRTLKSLEGITIPRHFLWRGIKKQQEMLQYVTNAPECPL